MEMSSKTDELRKIFCVLGGEKNANVMKVKTKDLIYGLENLTLKMDQKKREELITAIQSKIEGEYIDFDDFKEFFDLNKKVKKNKSEELKNTANQMYFLIQEILDIKDENRKLKKKDLKNIFEIIFDLDEIELDNEKKNNNQLVATKTLNKSRPSLNKSNLNSRSVIMKNNISRINKNTPTPNDEVNFCTKIKKDINNEHFVDLMIDCIDVDEDAEVSLADFEFLIQNYLEWKANNAV